MNTNKSGIRLLRDSNPPANGYFGRKLRSVITQHAKCDNTEFGGFAYSAAGSCERHAIPSSDERALNAFSYALGIACRSQDPAALRYTPNPLNFPRIDILKFWFAYHQNCATKISGDLSTSGDRLRMNSLVRCIIRPSIRSDPSSLYPGRVVNLGVFFQLNLPRTAAYRTLLVTEHYQQR